MTDTKEPVATQVSAMSNREQSAQKFSFFYATMVTVASFAFLFYAAFFQDYDAHPESKDIINLILGFLLGTALTSFIQFYFGSSSGSKSKDDSAVLRSLIDKNS